MDQSPTGPLRAAELEAFVATAHAVGRDVLARHADAVDADARFPTEAIDALRAACLLGAYVPVAHGGLGLDLASVATLCEVLGQYCASTALIYAMHQSQIACLVHHVGESARWHDELRHIAERRLLVASVTTELGTGGDVRSSICALETQDGECTLTKQAPVISYGRHADVLLVTCRRAADAPAGDQVLLLLHRAQVQLTVRSGWDTLGFRGTCSEGFLLEARCDPAQVVPDAYARIHQRTMQPGSHILWAAVWLGIATAALGRARTAVRQEARKRVGVTPLSAVRLADADVKLDLLRATLAQAVERHRAREAACAGAGDAAQTGLGFAPAIALNGLKLAASELTVDIVSRAMLICGIAGYRNDSALSLGRHLRDAYGAALMINNDRILEQSATMQLACR